MTDRKIFDTSYSGDSELSKTHTKAELEDMRRIAEEAYRPLLDAMNDARKTGIIIPSDEGMPVVRRRRSGKNTRPTN